MVPRPLLIFSQSDYLILIVAIKIHILNGTQCRSRSVGFWRSQMIWIYTVCKGRVYPGSAGLGLISISLKAHLIWLCITMLWMEQRLPAQTTFALSHKADLIECLNKAQISLQIHTVWSGPLLLFIFGKLTYAQSDQGLYCPHILKEFFFIKWQGPESCAFWLKVFLVCIWENGLMDS